MSKLADGIKNGEFRGRCPGLTRDTPNDRGLPQPCAGGEFNNYADYEAHMMSEHMALLRRSRARRTNTWTGDQPRLDTKPRTQPYGLPAVTGARQKVLPGEFLELDGRQCQVIGHTSPANVRILMWAEHGDVPKHKSAVTNGNDSGLILWDLVLPTNDVVDAIKATRGVE